MAKRKINGRTAFLQLLVDEGVTHLFGNPGTTELALMEVVPKFPQLRYVMGLQESLVLGMADGFARASGRLTAVNLHCTPGLGHAMGALFNARFSGSPVIVTAGQYEIGHGLTEPLLYDELVPIARPLVKWATEVHRIEDLPRIVHRAAKVAMAPPTGPVFLSLPGSVLDEEAEIDLGHPTRVETAVRPSDAVVERIARRLLAAQRPVILAGAELGQGDGFATAAKVAELLGAPVYRESVPYNSRFPAEHPAHMGDITRNQPKIRETLSAYDLMICLGADLLRMSAYSPTDPLPDGMPVVHLSERDWELGKNYPTELAVCANVGETLRALVPVLERLRTAEQAKAAAHRLEGLLASNWNARRRQLAQQYEARAAQRPMDQDLLMLRLADAIPAGTTVVDETLTCAPALAATLKANAPQDWMALASGGLGFGMPGAVGAALANPDRPVVAIIGDGSSLYSIQALWTAANQKLPITFVIVNNRGYRIIKDRLIAMRGTDAFVGMDMNDPPMDFVALAAGFGMAGRRVDDQAAIGEALREAIASGRPNLIEVPVANGFESTNS